MKEKTCFMMLLIVVAQSLADPTLLEYIVQADEQGNIRDSNQPAVQDPSMGGGFPYSSNQPMTIQPGAPIPPIYSDDSHQKYIKTTTASGKSVTISTKDKAQLRAMINHFKAGETCNNKKQTKPTLARKKPVAPLDMHRIVYRQGDEPLSITLVNSVKKWWPESELLSSLNVPTYAPNNGYKYVVLSLWTTRGPADAAAVWAEPTKYFPADSEFGSTDKEIRQNLKRLFKNANVKLLIGAFGSIEMPAYIGKNPAATARMLSNFVIENDFDGVYVSWQDTRALEGGYGVDWLVSFQSILRADLANHLIIHSPQAPYFQKNYYKDGGYHVVNEKIGFTIDFYSIQFYNQGYGQYENEKNLFYRSSNFFPGTSLLEIVSGGVSKEKIIISKPVCSRESSEGGYIPASKLNRWAERQRKYSGWSTGFAFWQYENDSDGHFLKRVLKI